MALDLQIEVSRFPWESVSPPLAGVLPWELEEPILV
jgi:hypothetical protein